MPFGIVAYALMFFSWTTSLETAVYSFYVSGEGFFAPKYQAQKNIHFLNFIFLASACPKL